MKPRIPWLRIMVEGLAVVTSILLAFAIDRSWERYRDRQDEREALAVVDRDLSATVDLLHEFLAHDDAKAAASFAAYQALSAPVPESDRGTVSDQILQSFRRRTIAIPSAGYTDLIASGTLGQIESRPVRDSVIGFYERAELIATVVEKNTSTFTDQFMGEVFTTSGLVLRRPAAQGLGGRLPPDFEHPSDPLWEFSHVSPEWARARSVLLQNGRGAETNLILVEEVLEHARRLQTTIRAYLDLPGST